MSATFWGTLGIQLAMAVFFYGMLVQKVKDHNADIRNHDVKIDDHEKRITTAEVEIKNIQHKRFSAHSGG